MAGRSGNQGSRSGGVGAVGGSSDFVPVLPDRVDLPFVTSTYDSGKHIWDDLLPVQQFPEKRWAAEWRAWYALSEYAQTNWKTIPVEDWAKEDSMAAGSAQDSPGETNPGPVTEDPKPTRTEREIKQLVVAARDERADALGEIIAQHQSFADYFFGLLGADPALYPKTALLIHIASIVATFTVLHFKNGAGKYKPRPRPSQVCPALLPPVPVPGHPSYPSGHATEAHLIASVLNEVFSKSGSQKFRDAMAHNLGVLAARIARNREIAGLHYPSDSDAGRALAGEILTRLKTYRNEKGEIVCKDYENAIEEAQKEWGL